MRLKRGGNHLGIINFRGNIMEFRIERAARIGERLREATGASWYVRAEVVAYRHKGFTDHGKIEFDLSVVREVGKDPCVIQSFKTFSDLVARAHEIILKHRKF